MKRRMRVVCSSACIKLTLMSIAAVSAAWSQTVSLSLSGGSGAPGATVTVGVGLSSSSGALPAAVQWDLLFVPLLCNRWSCKRRWKDSHVQPGLPRRYPLHRGGLQFDRDWRWQYRHDHSSDCSRHDKSFIRRFFIRPLCARLQRRRH